MPDHPHTLRPATPEELEQALSHALRFDGRKQFKVSGEMMARITAAHLVEQLLKSDFVVMKKPPSVATIDKHPPMTPNKHLTD